MNRLMCMNGHYYDGEKYQECPHCAEGIAPIAPSHFDVIHQNAMKQEDKKVKKEKKGLFSKKEVKVEVLPIQEESDKTERLFERPDTVTEPISNKEHISEKKNEESPLTSENVNEQSNIYAEQNYISQNSQSASGAMKQASLQSEFYKAMEPVQPIQQPQEATKVDLDNMKTVGYYSTGKATEPPVGYLICTKGDDYGTGFLLKSGNNTIGRSASMDVVVMDMKVSREKQAFVMYEPHKREFYVKPGEGSGLCYFNGDVVLGPMKMNAYDKIGVGNTELMLIPVCTQEFSWDDL